MKIIVETRLYKDNELRQNYKKIIGEIDNSKKIMTYDEKNVKVTLVYKKGVIYQRENEEYVIKITKEETILKFKDINKSFKMKTKKWKEQISDNSIIFTYKLDSDSTLNRVEILVKEGIL